MSPPSSDRRIGYVPYFDATVEKGYTMRMREAFGTFGSVVRFDDVMPTWRGHGRRLDLLVLNWTDNALLDRRTRKIALRKVVKLFVKTCALRMAARRLVFVRHNVYPHAVAPGHEQAAERWVDRYERLFDVVVSHSGDDGQRSRRYCPHPLYPVIDQPKASRLSQSLPARFFVVFGRIVRYKQLEQLMTAFPEDQTLVVIGALADAAYANELAAIARPNVPFRPGLIDEAEAQAIVSRSTALLISHADRDVIVSSSFFFAMSVGVRVIAVETPFLAWIAPRLGSMVRLESDVGALCRRVNLCTLADVTAEERVAVEREFGDAAVHAALQLALRMEST